MLPHSDEDRNLTCNRKILRTSDELCRTTLTGRIFPVELLVILPIREHESTDTFAFNILLKISLI
jgi:hypothetical protein